VDPECQLDLGPGDLIKGFRYRQVWGGLGVRGPGTYACLRDWDKGMEGRCGARVGEHVCFRHIESEERFELLGTNSALRYVKPGKAAEKEAKYKEAHKMHALSELFEAMRLKHGAAAGAWWDSE